MRRAVEKYDFNGDRRLTLSKNQHARAQQVCWTVSTPTVHVRCCCVGLEGFSGDPVDRIVSIEALRALRLRELRPLLQERVQYHARRRADDGAEQCGPITPYDLNARGKKITFETATVHQVHPHRRIFPGGRLPSTGMMVEHGEKAGFYCARTAFVARELHQDTCESGATALEAKQRHGHRDPVRRGLRAGTWKYLRGCGAPTSPTTVNRRQPGSPT